MEHVLGVFCQHPHRHDRRHCDDSHAILRQGIGGSGEDRVWVGQMLKDIGREDNIDRIRRHIEPTQIEIAGQECDRRKAGPQFLHLAFVLVDGNH